MNFKIDSSTVVFSCETCKTFKNSYFVEHRRTAEFAIDIDVKYSHPGQQVNTSVISYTGGEWLEMTKVLGLANFKGPYRSFY